MVINSIAMFESIYRQIKHLWVTGSPKLKPSLFQWLQDETNAPHRKASMPEVSFWLNSVFAEARFNFSLNGAEKDFTASSPRSPPDSLCVVSASTNKSKKRETNLFL